MLDLFIIGGGVNGAGIARDAAGRGLKVGLVDAGDFGGATSSASSKLLHGGLRYLEFGEFRLVHKALNERAIIFSIAPHLAKPLAFVLPRLPHSHRSAWLVRLGLWLYDHLGNRGGMPAMHAITLQTDRAGQGVDPKLRSAWRYWDGWIDDSRLVIANLRDAEARGAWLRPYDGVVGATQTEHGWDITLASGERLTARFIINAAGPWAEQVARDVLRLADAPKLRLVQGAHIVIDRPTSAEDALVVEQPDGRIVFLIPWLENSLMIGTTDTPIDHPERPEPTEAEVDYLIEAANRILAIPISRSDVCWTCAGVRPLVLEKGKAARETSRDWHLVKHRDAPAMSIVGGKITTYRKLAEDVLAQVTRGRKTWTAGVPLIGGDFRSATVTDNRTAWTDWLAALVLKHAAYEPAVVMQFAHRYGTEAEAMLTAGLGRKIGGLYEAELQHLVTKEWARTADDILLRRTRVGVNDDGKAFAEITQWLKDNL